MEAYFQALEQFEKDKEPLRTQLERCAHDFTQALAQQSASLSPTLRHIVPEDLQDTARLLALFEHAQREGLIGKSDGERLTFISLAEHARVVGTQNPCGLFAEILRRGGRVPDHCG
jgi:hypothetical protein